MSRIKSALQIVFLVAVTVFVVIYLREQWDQIRAEQIRLNWGLLILSQALVMIVWFTFPLTPYLIMRDLNIALPTVTVWRVFYAANAAKYLPGGIWALPGQVFLYQREGIPAGRGVVLVFWEVLIKSVAAAIVSLCAIPVITHFLPWWLVLGALALGVGVLALVWFVVPIRAWILRHAGRLPKFITRPFSEREDRLSLARFIALTIRYVGVWLLTGLAFIVMVKGITPDFSLSWSVQAVGVAMGSWLAGYLFILSPGGIGVRDVLIILGMGIVLDAPYPAVIAVVARISWTLAEFSCLLMSIAVERWLRPQTVASIE